MFSEHAVRHLHAPLKSANFVHCEVCAKTSIPTIAVRCLPAAIFLVLATAAAGAFAAEEESWLAGRPAVDQRGWLLCGLLTWPKDEGDKENEGGEKKDEENKDEEKEEPLESDRPDFTDSSTTVGFKRFQIESGYTYTHGEPGDPRADTHDLPELLLRYGVAERLELRLAWDEGMVFSRRTNLVGRVITADGSTDLAMGFKYALTKQLQWRPQSALIVEITAPAGSPAFSSRQVDTRLNYLYSWELNKRLSLNCSTGNTWTSESGDRLSVFHQSASVEYELTERFHVFNEWFAFYPSDSSDNRPQHYYDSGFTYLLTPNFQLDWRAGLGLNDAASGFFTGCGLTIRR